MHVLVTGASGYLGGAVLRALAALGHQTTAQSRRPGLAWPQGVKPWVVADLVTLDADALAHLRGVDCIVHCAARVHVMHDRASDPLTEFRRVNVQATLQLAQLAVSAGVRRFIFVSSIGIHGDTSGNKPFEASDPARPATPYAVSKWEAEQGLATLLAREGLELAVVRPPMIYGRGAPGNFALLRKLVGLGLPLPLGSLHAQRSFVSLDNMVDFLAHLVQHPAPTNNTYLVSDAQDMSTTAFIGLMSAAMGRPAVLLPVPVSLLTAVARLAGRADQLRKMAVPLTLDISRTRSDLGWTPPLSVAQSLHRALAPAAMDAA